MSEMVVTGSGDSDEEYLEGDVITTGYEPRPMQAEIHQDIARFSVLAIHRRFGKTVLAINHGIDYGMKVPLPNPRVSFISPLYKQSKTVAWEYLKHYTYRIPNAKAYESELRVDIRLADYEGKPNYLRIQLFGADNPDSLRGMYHDFAIFDEFGNQPISIWTEVVSPALADRKGAALFLGTPNGRNHFYKLYMQAKQRYEDGDSEWFAATYSAEDTGHVDPEELAQQKANLPEAEYRQEFLCDWQANIRGSFYGAEMNQCKKDGRIMSVPYQPELPVHLAFDLGIDDYTAVWFIQCFQNQIWCIDYSQFSNVGLLDVLKHIREKPYVIGDVMMPWDIKIRELTSGKSRLETLEGLGFAVVVAPKLPLIDGINAVRMILPRCYFDSAKAEEGYHCLENYRKKYDQRTGEFVERPEHDEFSHGADAFRTFAVCYDPTYGDKINGGGFGGSLMGGNQQPRSVRSTA